MDCSIGAREDLQSDNLGASSEMTIGRPHNEPNGSPTSPEATETKAKRDLICIQDSVERTSRRTINETKGV